MKITPALPLTSAKRVQPLVKAYLISHTALSLGHLFCADGRELRVRDAPAPVFLAHAFALVGGLHPQGRPQAVGHLAVEVVYEHHVGVHVFLAAVTLRRPLRGVQRKNKKGGGGGAHETRHGGIEGGAQATGTNTADNG